MGGHSSSWGSFFTLMLPGARPLCQVPCQWGHGIAFHAGRGGSGTHGILYLGSALLLSLNCDSFYCSGCSTLPWTQHELLSLIIHRLALANFLILRVMDWRRGIFRSINSKKKKGTSSKGAPGTFSRQLPAKMLKVTLSILVASCREKVPHFS